MKRRLYRVNLQFIEDGALSSSEVTAVFLLAMLVCVLRNERAKLKGPQRSIVAMRTKTEYCEHDIRKSFGVQGLSLNCTHVQSNAMSLESKIVEAAG